MVILEMGVLLTICPGWPQTTILLISASQVARITSISHQHPGEDFLKVKIAIKYKN
jgi:hypothetical protein